MKLNVHRRVIGLALLWAIPLITVAADIRIVQVVPLSGAVARDAQNVVEGVKVGVAASNAGGGVRGNRIDLFVKDDQYQPENTLRLLEEAKKEGAVSAIMPVGSASINRVIESRLLQRIELPVVGVVPGSEALRVDSEKWIFHTRASDDKQVQRVLRHATIIGQKRFAVLYGDIPFGRSGLKALEKELASRQSGPVISRPFPMGNPEDGLQGLEVDLGRLNPDAIVVFGGATQSAKVIRFLREKRQFMSIYALSYADVATVCDVVGDAGSRGVAIAQVVPNHKSTAVQISRQFSADWTRFADPSAVPSQYAMEGYIAWKVLEKAIASTEGEITGPKVKQALEASGRFSIGGFGLEFSKENHNGTTFVDIGVVDRNCSLIY